MPATYVNIASQTLGSNTATVTFSSIPGTYTDLVIKASIRGNDASQREYMLTRFNSDTGTNYSNTRLNINSTTDGGQSVRQSNQTSITFFYSGDGNGATANTFGNAEVYIPSYTVSQNKPMFHHGTEEQNQTQSFMAIQAGLWRNTSAITSITITPVVGTSFLTGSSFYLYGIKNS
jgi:hypothetical protein